MGNDAYSVRARRVKNGSRVLASDFGLQENVISGVGMYLFDFIPRYVKRVLKEVRSRIRGYQFK